MVKGLHLYREQMVSEAVIGDLTDDVNERASSVTNGKGLCAPTLDEVEQAG
jgi:hypothetical protein